LEQESKRILQEASVIGRSFYYEILKRTTALNISIDEKLHGLEHRDLIKTKSIQPELEYKFKHALTQEVVYNGLLKKDRREIHERIANVIEDLFKDRLVEFYETLSFHFSKGLSLKKAISYLMNSAKKSLARYSIEESNQYYKHALELLESNKVNTNDERELLIDLLMGWAYVLYYRGHFKEMAEIFSAKIKTAESLENKTKLGMFYAWYGFSLYNQNRVSESYHWLEKALQIGEEIGDQLVIGYACTWLTWYYLTVCRIDQSIKHGERTQEISKDFESDSYLYFKSLGGLGLAYCASGDKKKTIDIGKELIDYGNKHSNIRSLTLGYNVLGAAYSYDNDITTAIQFYEKAIQVTAEPLYVEFIRFNLVLAYIVNDQITEAENAIDSIVAFCQESGAWIVGEPAQVFSGAIMIAKGEMGLGLKQLENGSQKLAKSGNIICSLMCDYILASVFSQIAGRSAPINLGLIAKNIGFLVKNVPVASRKAERLYKNVIAAAEEMGFMPIAGGACLDLGLLYKALKRRELAKEYISKASDVFKQCGSDVYLKQANDGLEFLQ
jgi:tetratricopeptide (TPR) repeat protein